MGKISNSTDNAAETSIDGIIGDVSGKKDYAEPTLMIYGTVRGMTATGTGTQKEAANSGGQSNPNDPQKRP